jgi:hypothetical protein
VFIKILPAKSKEEFILRQKSNVVLTDMTGGKVT